jgi:adenosylcobinamide kinase/adenosylcobinamide-phosphate guanylyltransferase
VDKVILVTGPARSGKSEWAEILAMESGMSVVYVATAQKNPDDKEWQMRIQQHYARRPSEWQTLEVPIDLVATIQTANANSCLLVDSLGTWVANLLELDEHTWEPIVQNLLITMQQMQLKIIFVAEETGWGVVPAYPIGRTFRDRLGNLVRRLGTMADVVYLVTGGYVLNLTDLGTPLPHAKR